MMSVEELKRRFPGMDVHPRLVFHVGRYLYLKHIYRRVSDGKIFDSGATYNRQCPNWACH